MRSAILASLLTGVLALLTAPALSAQASSGSAVGAVEGTVFTRHGEGMGVLGHAMV